MRDNRTRTLRSRGVLLAVGIALALAAPLRAETVLRVAPHADLKILDPSNVIVFWNVAKG
jgi:hypothetical protein